MFYKCTMYACMNYLTIFGYFIIFVFINDPEIDSRSSDILFQSGQNSVSELLVSVSKPCTEAVKTVFQSC